MTRSSRTTAKIGKILTFSTLLLGASMAQAEDFDTLQLLSQSQFRTLSENVAAATSYRGLVPAEPLGLIGFDVALAVSSTSIDDEIFDLASDGDFDIPQLIVPRLQLHKGLPFNFDVGVSLAAIPETDIKLVGAEVRYAILEGSIATPALSVRLSYSRLEGLDELEIDSTGVEALISKGFANFTPYGGVGYVRSDSSTNVEDLEDETLDQTRVFAGLNINFGINVGLELDRTDDYTTFSLRTGLRF